MASKAKNIPAEQALEYVFGYTVLNDITARDLQRQGKQFFKGKSLDGSCPMGPWIVTADALPNPRDLDIRCLVNGVEKQASNTRHMIFDIPTTIAYLSRGMTLLPGDIIATGTPDGVGFARTPPEFLRPGDVVTSIVEGIGELTKYGNGRLILLKTSRTPKKYILPNPVINRWLTNTAVLAKLLFIIKINFNDKIKSTI